jgi:hypothetical protein
MAPKNKSPGCFATLIIGVVAGTAAAIFGSYLLSNHGQTNIKAEWQRLLRWLTDIRHWLLVANHLHDLAVGVLLIFGALWMAWAILMGLAFANEERGTGRPYNDRRHRLGTNGEFILGPVRHRKRPSLLREALPAFYLLGAPGYLCFLLGSAMYLSG